ncbi:MAG TPA: hypothetical protein PKY77_13450 [Phycisphaerae bacterium]|nr:hypothetical protein [Phycisphaerae bacterium]HRY68748.1 hypothetical protein [Phycisphaerae bacterium]HSA28929.1 hypothetical protein [Phycisphaerae bacterium]
MTRKLTSLLMVLGMAGGALFQSGGCNIAITPIEPEEEVLTSTVQGASSVTPAWGQYPSVWATSYVMGGWGGY